MEGMSFDGNQKHSGIMNIDQRHAILNVSNGANISFITANEPSSMQGQGDKTTGEYGSRQVNTVRFFKYATNSLYLRLYFFSQHHYVGLTKQLLFH